MVQRTTREITMRRTFTQATTIASLSLATLGLLGVQAQVTPVKINESARRAGSASGRSSDRLSANRDLASS